MLTIITTFDFFSAAYVLSRKGKRMIKINGYTYSHYSGSGAKIRWKCSTHQPAGCKAMVITVGDEIIILNEAHHHEIINS